MVFFDINIGFYDQKAYHLGDLLRSVIGKFLKNLVNNCTGQLKILGANNRRKT